MRHILPSICLPIFFLLLLGNTPTIASTLSGNESGKTSREQAQAAIRKAETLQTTAQSVGFEWTTIEPLIASARELLTQGKLKEAQSVASEAILHAQLAIQQSKHAKQHWHLEAP